MASSVVLLGAVLSWAGPVEDARDQLRQAFPDVQFYVEGASLARVWGAPFG